MVLCLGLSQLHLKREILQSIYHVLTIALLLCFSLVLVYNSSSFTLALLKAIFDAFT